MLGWLEAIDAAAATRVAAQAISGEDCFDAAHELLSARPRPTAVLCFSDVFAFAVLQAAKALGLDVPGDLSVVGFDDIPAARTSSPPLTTVRQDAAAKGRLAAAALNAVIDHDASSAPVRVRHHLLPTELVVRATTAPPSART